MKDPHTEEAILKHHHRERDPIFMVTSPVMALHRTRPFTSSERPIQIRPTDREGERDT